MRQVNLAMPPPSGLRSLTHQPRKFGYMSPQVLEGTRIQIIKILNVSNQLYCLFYGIRIRMRGLFVPLTVTRLLGRRAG